MKRMLAGLPLALMLGYLPAHAHREGHGLPDWEFFRFVDLGPRPSQCEAYGGQVRRIWAIDVQPQRHGGQTLWAVNVNAVHSVRATTVGVFSERPSRQQLASLNGKLFCDAP